MWFYSREYRFVPTHSIEHYLNYLSMEASSERIRRYLDDELDGCRSEDVDARLEELGTLETALGRERLTAELDVLSALANQTRLTVVRALVVAGEELCVCELVGLVDVSESGLSHALSQLVDAGLVEWRKDGRWKKYRATNRAVAILTVLSGSVDGVDDVAGEASLDGEENE